MAFVFKRTDVNVKSKVIEAEGSVWAEVVMNETCVVILLVSVREVLC